MNRLFQYRLCPQVRNYIGCWIAINAYHPVFVSGGNDTEQSVTYCLDCRPACPANGSDILCCLRLGKVVEVTPQCRRTCRNDWCE